ncbi:MAG TPA: VIT1/CCC1 transporter family protein [Candidatus Krumholzibacteria bacterium]|nr:VIT1/CCC1 transporter family protein [Candidatus Krumholzibacteria bacterium]
MTLLRFVRRNLEPVDRLGETLFGLIMALGITGAARLGIDEADNRSLFIAVLGCNIAWGIVDGAMFVLAQLFERGRQARVVRAVRAAPDDATALRLVAREVDGRLEALTTGEELEQVHRWILTLARRTTPRPARVTGADFRGGLAAALVVFLATVPVVIPFLVVRDVWWATRLSNATGLVLLFGLGSLWARFTGSNPALTGLGVAALGILLVVVTILLGG